MPLKTTPYAEQRNEIQSATGDIVNTAGTPAPATPCLVVGIGASAGGQEALEQLFTAMPTDCGLSFVVVMHLPSGGPSFLAEMLGRYTSMDVATAEEGMPLKPNRVYVIPAGRELTVSQDLLRLHPAEPTEPRSMAPKIRHA